ncbi:MAG: hypothetical protein U0325_24860 [Polyangiales bacterium]
MSPRWRGVLAGLLGLVGAVYVVARMPTTAKSGALFVPATLLVAALAAPTRHLGLQLLARGVWWSNFLFGALLTAFGGRTVHLIGPVLLFSCGAALMAADRRALHAASARERLRPAAYAGTLQLMMVLALADAQTLGFFAFVVDAHHVRERELFGACSAFFLAAFVGLMRLSTWGVALSMASSLALLVAMLTRAVITDRDLRIVLYGMAALQLVTPLPMLASMARGRPLPAPSPRAQAWLANAVILAVVLLCLVARR